MAPSTRIELAYRGRQPRILTRGLREQGVRAEGIEPPSAVCRTAALPLDEARYRRWVLAPRDRAYETRLRAGAAGVVPTRGVEPLEPAFVAPVPNSVGVGKVSASGFEPESLA